ncbi:MAG: glutathione binding-like protein [Myxococcota bacterium]
MIDLYFFPTPNGLKLTIALEELELPYRVIPINIMKGDQFKPEFLAISPNNKMPALVDHEPLGGGEPLTVFESGAMLLYLAEKTGKLLPQDLRARYEVTQWLFWQMAGLGPMTGQANHFIIYAKEKVPYAMDRYLTEVKRLLSVLDKQLSTQEYIAGEYSVADIASLPWVIGVDRLGVELSSYPQVDAWVKRLQARPAVQRGLAVKA